MINKFRRKFIVAISLSAFSVSSFSKTTSFLVGDPLDDKAKEFLSVYRIWLDTMNIEPDEYLHNRGIMSFEDKTLIREASVNDYNARATIHVNGFVLSLAEAAVIACFGSSYCG